MSGFPEYDRYDGLGLAELVRKGEVKPTELVEEAIMRIEKLNPKLNAVIHKMYDQAREKAKAELPDGPFKGVPFLMFAKTFMTIVCAETMAGIEKSEFLMGRKAKYRDFEPSTWMLALLGKQLRAPRLSNAKFTLQYMSRLVCHFSEKFDILLTPTLALPPIKIGALQPNKKDAFIMKLLGCLNAGGLLMAVKGIEDLAQKAYTFMPYTPLFNVTGQPAMSVPLHWNDEGLPIGMQFVGRTADEATLFRLAGQLEKVKLWSNRIPPICSES